MSSNSWRLWERRETSARSGNATLELALCLPVLVFIFLGTIDACNVLYLKQSLQLAAYQGGRVAAKSGASTEQVATACREFLAGRGISSAEADISPTDVATVQPGQPIRIILSIDAADLCYVIDSGSPSYTVEGAFVVTKRQENRKLEIP